MIDSEQASAVLRIFGILGRLANRCRIGGLQPVGDADLVEIGVGGKRQEAAVLIFPS